MESGKGGLNDDQIPTKALYSTSSTLALDACVMRKGFEIAAGALRIQHTQRKGGFAGTRHPGNTHDFPQRNIDVYIF